MIYLYINDGHIGAVVPEFDKDFPNVPIEQRYSKDFLSKCVTVEDEVAETLTSEHLYNAETKEFYIPEPPEPPTVEENPNQIIDETISVEHKTYAEKLTELETENAELKEQITSLEDCILEMADVVYA